jgi:hypothetical protein
MQAAHGRDHQPHGAPAKQAKRQLADAFFNPATLLPH